MHALDHWHPVLLEDDLGEGPTRVRLHGRDIAVFRTDAGRLGAVADVCVHRRMQLSEGWVEGDRLVCPYHGWSYEADGAAFSPGTPPVKACATHYEAIARHGAVWLRRPGAATAFPRHIERPGYFHVAQYRHRIKAPLLIVLDNFTEVEHTATTHALLGYPIEAMADVEVEVVKGDDRVRVINRGPQKPISPVVKKLFGIGPRDDFVDDWTTYFSPIYTVYDQYWIDPATDDPRPDRLHIAVFFTPVEEGVTELFTFVGARMRSWRRFGLKPLLRRITSHFTQLEIELDVAMLEKLADKSPELRGMTLGRFDDLRENRKRYHRIYLGQGGDEGRRTA